MKPLAIIPVYVRDSHAFDVTSTTLTTLRETTGDDLDALVVDDHSPELDLRQAVSLTATRLGMEVTMKADNEGFSKAVNVGLRQALQQGRDAILVNADIEFTNETWLKAMQDTWRSDGSGKAEIIGARLVYPNGLLQHAGVYFSILYRTFDHVYRYGPSNLPQALRPRVCPVTAALQYIRFEALEKLGVYDERFRMGFEDVDYCVRAWQEGLECVYQPRALATHHESLFRGSGRSDPAQTAWQNQAWPVFADKWGGTNLVEFVPAVI